MVGELDLGLRAEEAHHGAVFESQVSYEEMQASDPTEIRSRASTWYTFKLRLLPPDLRHKGNGAYRSLSRPKMDVRRSQYLAVRETFVRSTVSQRTSTGMTWRSFRIP